MPDPIIISADLAVGGNPGDSTEWGSAYGCGAALAIAEYAARDACPLLVLASGVSEAEQLLHDLEFFAAHAVRERLRLFPDIEILPYDTFSPHQDLVSQRLKALRELGQTDSLIVVTAAATLLPRLPPRTYVDGRGIALRVGQQLDQREFCRRLEDAGYQRVPQVSIHGDFAVRGSLIDLYPTGSELPVRVDFLDDQIDSLRTFDPDSQLSSGELEAIDTLPAREMPIDEEAIKQFRQHYRRRFEGNPSRSEIYSEVSEGRLPAGIESYLPLFFESTATLWDYLPDNTLIVMTEGAHAALEKAWTQIGERHEQFRHDADRPILDPDEIFLSPERQLEQINKHPRLTLHARALPDEILAASRHNLPVRPAPLIRINQRDADPTGRLREFLSDPDQRTLIVAETTGRREQLADSLRSAHENFEVVSDWAAFATGTVGTGLIVGHVVRGAQLTSAGVTLLCEDELFGDRPRSRRRRRRVRDPETLIHDLTDLRPGAPVVHEEHGIGRYVGLTDLNLPDARTEFVTLEYAGGDRLHVPVTALHLISRYTGVSPEHAPLHRLGSDQWARVRRKAAARIRDVAAELLELYARRAARQGRSASPSQHDYEAFAAGFPFVVTEDQARAIEEVLDDLSATAPMDRLVCGDVGFGKTEVALRAAFAAVTSGWQVAILVPTTLLAQQHYQTFSDRFADWPVRVELLSRFRTERTSREVIAGLKRGTVDIVIGTHRLLQPGIEFANLGLVIVDEEHRFGVRHKERLKSLRNEADILTLTATPIPRTLNMSLGGLREMSLIATPPETRLSIKTFVGQWNDSVIREACLREMKRGGQIYFVHNRIEDIFRIAEKLGELLPESRIEVAHGQMRETELERIMLDFYHRRFHILVCTAIIESGLDVPSANTILINRADRFGLAQLHQLRGRVGRSHHQAFAYLITPPEEALTADAKKRLTAIESLEDLGAGFVLATHDLEIRGAGEILGEDQSGQIQEIGFALYNDMLSRTVEALRNGLDPELNDDGGKGPEIEMHVPALLPEDYLPDVHMRLVHYKRIASAPDDQALKALRVELIDRFGLLPEATQNLFRLTTIRRLVAPLGIQRLDIGAAGGFIDFATDTRIDPLSLIGLIESEPERYRFDGQQRLRIRAELADEDQRFEFVESLLQHLSAGA